MTKGRVYLRGRTWWVAYYYKGKDRCETSRSTDKKDAELLLGKRLGEIGADAAGVRRWLGPQAERVLVTALLEDLMLDYRIRGARGLEAARGRMPPLRDSFYREQVREINTPRLRRYVQERQRAGMAPATIKLELAFLHRAFVLAHREGRIGQVPMFPAIEVNNVRQGFFEQADFDAVCALLPPVLADLARFAYLSGWRKSEVRDLQWAEVDLAGRVVKLPPERAKNKKGRTLPLVGELWEIICRRQTEKVVWSHNKEGLPDGYICAHVFHREGKPIRHFLGAWHTACRKAGVEGMLFHDLRRTAVRNLTRAGVPQRVAMEITGHKTATVFSRYDITDEADLRLGQEKMQAYLKGDTQERKIILMEGTA
jgi:integrase